MRSSSKIILLILLFLSITNVSAAECDSDTLRELKKEATYIKASYEETYEQISDGAVENPEPDLFDPVPVYQTYFKISFMNITENLKLEITNESTKEKITVNYSDTDNGIYILKHVNVSSPTKYSYKIYPGLKMDCVSSSIKSGKITIPALNSYAYTGACEGYEDLYFCKKYVTFDVTEVDVGKLLNEYITKEAKKTDEDEKKQEDSLKTKFLDFLNQNKILLIIIGSSLLLGIGIYIVFKIKQRKKMIV